MDVEKRFATGVSASGRKLVGYVAKWDVPANIGDFTEVIRRGAFRASLDSGVDVLALADHDPTAVLGRTSSGTLVLREDDVGLAFELSLPDTTDGRDIAALAERGDLGGCSFGFTASTDGQRWTGTTRELLSVNLAEVSIVQSWPAYANTEGHLRQRGNADPQVALLKYWLETLR